MRSVIDRKVNASGLDLSSGRLKLDFGDQRMSYESQVLSIRIRLVVVSRGVASPVVLGVDSVELVEAADS